MSNEKRNPAGVALFHIQFGLMMLNTGRADEGNDHLVKAQEILNRLEKDLDGEAVAA